MYKKTPDKTNITDNKIFTLIQKQFFNSVRNSPHFDCEAPAQRQDATRTSQLTEGLPACQARRRGEAVGRNIVVQNKQKGGDAIM